MRYPLTSEEKNTKAKIIYHFLFYGIRYELDIKYKHIIINIIQTQFPKYRQNHLVRINFVLLFFFTV